MVSFRVLQTNGTPVPGKQVIVRTLGRWDFGITGVDGLVHLPLEPGENGRIIIGGQSVYLGDLGLDTLFYDPPSPN